MKKRTVLVLALFVVLSLVTGAIYKRPLTLAQLCPEVSLDSCTSITAYYSVDRVGEEATWAPSVFSSGSEKFNQLMDQVQQQTFRKSFQNFFPSGTKTHPFSEGNFRWEITLEYDDSMPMKDGSTASGSLIHLTNFYGDLTIDNMTGEQSIQCHAKDQQQWAEEILHILSGED